MSNVVFWLDRTAPVPTPRFEVLSTDLHAALTRTDEVRNTPGASHVMLSTAKYQLAAATQSNVPITGDFHVGNVVFWLEHDSGQPVARAKTFPSDQLSQALDYAAQVRRTPATSHECIASEMEHCTSKAGVSAPASDYNWKKRRR